MCASSENPCPPLPEVVYVPGRVRKLGIRIWPQMLRDVLRSKDLIWRLFLRNWAAHYRQSWLGYVWAVVPSVVAVLSFWYLARRRVLPIGATPIPYVAYALWGLSVWRLFTACYNTAAGALNGAGPMISRINFPKEALIFASIGRALFDFLIRLVMIAVVFVWFRIVPAWTAILLPLALLPVVLMALGFGMIISVLSVAGADIANVISITLNFGMLVTPVIYPPLKSWPLSLLNVFNPVSPVIIASHDLLERGSLSMPGPYVMSWLFAVLLFGVGWRFFCLAMPRVAERF